MTAPIDRVIDALFSAGCKPARMGSGWTARCPAHDDTSPSLTLAIGDDDRVLMNCHSGCDSVDILDRLGLKWQHFFAGNAQPPRPHGPEWVSVVPVPKDAPGPRPHPTLGRSSARWIYRDAEGRLAGWVLRWDGDSGKEIRPLTWGRMSNEPEGSERWEWRAWSGAAPLYGLDLLAAHPDVPVLVVEGEKTAHAAQDYFDDTLVAVTSPGGASRAHKADWSPLAGRIVTVWPDADAAGRKYAEHVAQFAHKAGAARVRIVQVPDGWPAGWDLADPPQDDVDLGAMLEAAVVWSPRPDLVATPEVLEQLKPRPATPETPSTPEWPTLQRDALYGLAGEIVNSIAPRTESDPVAILAQLLVAVGSAIGRAPYFMVEADRHGCNEFVVLVGRSARSRKGTAAGHVRRLLRGADEGWSSDCTASGLGSGEGLVWAIRDPIVKMEKGAEVVVDSGVEDKRILAFESEFASVLKVIQRPGSTLSPVIRDAWDSHDLRTTVKNSPARATAPHVSLLGHITGEELRALLLETECANGFANRVMWLLVRRARLLPEGGGLMGNEFAGFVRQLQRVLDHGRRCGEVKRTPEAREAWCAVYPELSADRPGLMGAMTARAEAHCVRLSLLYAMLDCSPVIEVQHLAAALAFWKYAEDSCRYVFGSALGDPVADRLLDVIRTSPEGVTMTVLHDALGRNLPASRITAALQHLEGLDLIHLERLTKTGGRPAIVWRAK